MKKQNQRVIFTDKAELIFSKIVQENNLQETLQKTGGFSVSHKESPEMIARMATVIMARKTVSEEKVSELLQKHLNLPQESIRKIMDDIKNRLLPLLLVYPEENFQNPIFRNEISKKVFGQEKQLTDSQAINAQVKKIEVPDVEKNAQELQKKRTGKIQKNTIGEQIKNKGQDRYREPIE